MQKTFFTQLSEIIYQSGGGGNFYMVSNINLAYWEYMPLVC